MEQELIRILLLESSDSDFEGILESLEEIPGATSDVTKEIASFRNSIKEFSPKQLKSWEKRRKKEPYDSYLRGILLTLHSILRMEDIHDGRDIASLQE